MSTKKKSVKKVTAKKNTPKPLFLRPKPIKVVTKKVLQSIADSIYNPKTGKFLNLCNGTLQNGPDPVCPTRPCTVVWVSYTSWSRVVSPKRMGLMKAA